MSEKRRASTSSQSEQGENPLFKKTCTENPNEDSLKAEKKKLSNDDENIRGTIKILTKHSKNLLVGDTEVCCQLVC